MNLHKKKQKFAMVKSAESSISKNTGMAVRKQRSQGSISKTRGTHKFKNTFINKNEKSTQITKINSYKKSVGHLTVNSAITTQICKRNVYLNSTSASCNSSKAMQERDKRDSSNVNLQKLKQSSRNNICSRGSVSNSLTLQSNTTNIPNAKYTINSSTKRTTVIQPSTTMSWKRGASRVKNEPMVHLLNDKIIYSEARYKEIKDFVSKAIQQKKIFILYGKCRAIRSALKQRGWVEKLTFRAFDNLKRELPFNENILNADSKIETLIMNNLLLRNNPNLIWLVRSNEKILGNNLYRCPLINRIKIINKHFTTKAGLCSALKYQHWFHINGISDVNSPRSYNIFDNDELEDFQVDYRITACTNLLRWFVKNKDEQENIMSDKGKIAFSVIFFALKRCQAFIQRKQHKDIDKIIRDPKPAEWDTYVDNYYKLIFNRQKLKLEHRNVIDFYIVCSNEIIKFMRRYRPEIDCEGFSNIWILKPGSWSRGRGITVTNDLKTILNMSTRPRVQRYVIQKYVENPLLIYGTKFDIRQYYIITSTHPLTIWMYKNCYMRFSSQNYSLLSFHESIHLTNNAIQHKYTNNKKRNPNLPANNMWILQQFKDYLKTEGNELVWNTIVYQGMKKNIIGAMLNCQDGMINRINQFELYGCDFILDNNYKPWLIEINSCPDMSPSTSVTAKLCPQVMEDIIKVMVDHKRNAQASTGDFECIYCQRMTPPVFSTDMSSLVVQGQEDITNDRTITQRAELTPQYKEACSNETLRMELPWKHELIKLQSEEEFLKHVLIKIQSDVETLVCKYPANSSNSKHIELKIEDSKNTFGNDQSEMSTSKESVQTNNNSTLNISEMKTDDEDNFSSSNVDSNENSSKINDKNPEVYNNNFSTVVTSPSFFKLIMINNSKKSGILKETNVSIKQPSNVLENTCKNQLPLTTSKKCNTTGNQILKSTSFKSCKNKISVANKDSEVKSKKKNVTSRGAFFKSFSGQRKNARSAPPHNLVKTKSSIIKVSKDLSGMTKNKSNVKNQDALRTLLKRVSFNSETNQQTGDHENEFKCHNNPDILKPYRIKNNLDKKANIATDAKEIIINTDNSNKMSLEKPFRLENNEIRCGPTIKPEL